MRILQCKPRRVFSWTFGMKCAKGFWCSLLRFNNCATKSSLFIILYIFLTSSLTITNISNTNKNISPFAFFSYISLSLTFLILQFDKNFYHFNLSPVRKLQHLYKSSLYNWKSTLLLTTIGRALRIQGDTNNSFFFL